MLTDTNGPFTLQRKLVRRRVIGIDCNWPTSVFKPQSVDSELYPFAFRAFGTGSIIAGALVR